MTKRAKKIRAATAAPSPIVAEIVEAAAIAASVRIEVAGEGMLAETRRIVTGPAIEGEIRRHFRARQGALDVAGDPFAALFADALGHAQSIIAACTEEPPPRNSEADIAERMITLYDLARAAATRGDIWNFGVLASLAGVLAERLRLADGFNEGVVKAQRHAARWAGEGKRAAERKRRDAEARLRPLQKEAERLMRARPSLSNTAIARLAGAAAGIKLRPDSLRRHIVWPEDRRRGRKSTIRKPGTDC